jgi:dTDP-4-dehydrorhamnose reductase
MRVLLFGSNGQVGQAVLARHRFGDQLIAAAREDCDLTDAGSVRAMIRRARPQVIVNAAAYTAVDKAESDTATCYAVNAAAPAAMSEEAAAMGARLIHYSTDYVFDGSKSSAYLEEDATGPRNVYGASKLAGEQGIESAGCEYIVLRTSWVYSNHGSNFLKTMLRLGAERPELRVVADQRGAPTSAVAIAEATLRLLQPGGAWQDGVYHMTAGGSTSWHGFAEAIFERARIDPRPRLVPIATAEYPTPAARPANSVLCNDKFARCFGFRLPDWPQQLDAVLAERRVKV